MSKKVKTLLLLEVESDFEDEQSDEETVKYCLEEDLKEMGWQINKTEVRHKCHICEDLATEQGGLGLYYCGYHFKRMT
jgi:hypothetical protein